MNANHHPRIVILDGHTNNPGDLSWQCFEELGELTVYAGTEPDQVPERCEAADLVCTNKTVLTAQHLATLPKLRYIGVLATGVNVVDLTAAAAHNIAVTNVPNYGSASVAQHAIALLLACASRVAELDHSVRDGEWQRRRIFSYWLEPPIELAGKTLGLIGLGAIGQRVARIALALDMRVIAFTPSGRRAPGVESVTLEQLAVQADAISLHCPQTAANTGFIDEAFLDKLKPGVFLVNTARGGLLDEQAVAAHLHSARLGGLGADVLSSEPPAPDNPLLSAPNCVITPHSAWASREARYRLLQIAAANIRAFQNGESLNRIN